MIDRACSETAFPRLTDEQIQCVGSCGEHLQFADGEALVEMGQRDFPSICHHVRPD